MARLKEFAVAGFLFLLGEDLWYSLAANDWIEPKQFWLPALLSYVTPFLIMMAIAALISSARNDKARFIRNSIATVVYGIPVALTMFILFVAYWCMNYLSIELSPVQKTLHDLTQPARRYIEMPTPFPIRLSLAVMIYAPILYYGWKMYKWLDKYVGDNSAYARTLDSAFEKLQTTLDRHLDHLEDVLNRRFYDVDDMSP
jgi:hypothetical protein